MTTTPLPDPYDEPTLHLDARRRLHELHPGPATQTDLADALAFAAAHVVRSAWHDAGKVDIALRNGGRFGPQPAFAELRSRDAVLVTPTQISHLRPEDGRTLADALQLLYAAVELAGRKEGDPQSWAARFAAASTAPPASRPWRVAAAADHPGLYVLTLPPPRRPAAPGRTPEGTS
ncbi:hypothetical protein ABZ747_29380 [Kitasatospora cineracea]|uniref:hypothetical protein n=1 Tax=Kitasatospora cineracea TaxID=88074 RepID=UPI0033E09A7C